MTTLKELKELDAKATSAPWVTSLEGEIGECDWKVQISPIDKIAIAYAWGCNRKEVRDNAKLIAATRNALPDLIRVIELAEDELNHVDKIIKELKNDKYGRFRPTKAQGEAIWFSVSQALTEIRKLKGE